MRILGLDPGSATVGYGILEERDDRLDVVTYGVVTTRPKDGHAAQRLLITYNKFNALLTQYNPDLAGIEKLFFGKNITTAINVGQARGVLLLALAEKGIPVTEYSPPEIKEAVSGYGKATKQQVQYMVQQLFELDSVPKPDDAADGLAVAFTLYQRYRLDNLHRIG